MLLSFSSHDPPNLKSGVSIFYVDDSRSMLDLLTIFLEKNHHFDVKTCHCPKIALNTILENKPDIIISDYDMAGMNGGEFLEKIRSNGLDIPFIMYTSYGREEIGDAILGKDFVHYVHKWGSIYDQVNKLQTIIYQSLHITGPDSPDIMALFRR